MSYYSKSAALFLQLGLHLGQRLFVQIVEKFGTDERQHLPHPLGKLHRSFPRIYRSAKAVYAAGKPVLSIQMLEDRYALENHQLDAGEITTEQQEQALVVEMLQQYCDRVARYSTAGYSVVIHYINLHLKEDLTLSTLAARFNLSRSYLSDRLHREVHSNLTDYVTLTRIQFAANLLRYHHYTITQAAQEEGITVVPYPPVQAHHRRDAVPLRPVESLRGLRDEPAKKKNFAAALSLLAML